MKDGGLIDDLNSGDTGTNDLKSRSIAEASVDLSWALFLTWWAAGSGDESLIHAHSSSAASRSSAVSSSPSSSSSSSGSTSIEYLA